MTINYYSYEELVKAALDDPSKENLANLGDWFQAYGMIYWNGECFSIDSRHNLYPIEEEVEEDEWQRVGWELR